MFEDELLLIEKEIRKEKFRWRVLKLLTFGFLKNREKLNFLENQRQDCIECIAKFSQLSLSAKILDEELAGNTFLEGVRLSSVTRVDSPRLDCATYPHDWIVLRDTILHRDNHECTECDPTCSGPLQVHHLIPLSKGGTNDHDNLVTLCQRHHEMKHPHMMR